MSIALPPELEEFVQKEIASGRYQDKTDLFQAGLRLLRERELKRQALEREIQKGIDDLERGHYTTLKNNQELREYFDSIPERARKKKLARDSETK